MNDVIRHEGGTNAPYRAAWVAWPVYWSAVWVGALTALAVALILGLVGTAIGAHVVYADPWIETNKIGWGTVIFAIVGSFLAFVAGGWVAGRIAGLLQSEPAMLHGGVVWLVAVPMLMVLAALGAGGFFGGWYGGLAGRPAWAQADLTRPAAGASEAEMKTYEEQRQEARQIARNTALGAVTALLLSLVGSVIGGWMASGEPMTLTHYKTRQRTTTTTGSTHATVT